MTHDILIVGGGPAEAAGGPGDEHDLRATDHDRSASGPSRLGRLLDRPEEHAPVALGGLQDLLPLAVGAGVAARE